MTVSGDYLRRNHRDAGPEQANPQRDPQQFAEPEGMAKPEERGGGAEPGGNVISAICDDAIIDSRNEWS